MKAFANQNARSVEEAVTLAQQSLQGGQSVSFVGGGTDLLQLMKDRVVNRPGSELPDVLVNLKTVGGLDQVTPSAQGGATIGGMITLDALSQNALVRDRFSVLAEAAESVASPQIRFFVLPRQDAEHENVLADDEVLASVELPAPGSGMRSAFHKEMDREAWTHALASAAVVLDMDGGVVRSARIVLGGVAPIPWRVPEAEALLAGNRVTPEVARAVGAAAVAGARAMSKNAYKIPLARSVVERTVLTLATSA